MRPKAIRPWQATDTGSYDTMFAQKIPSADLRLLSGGQNLGAVEIITFMPHSLKNGDVVKRLVMNGWTQGKIANVLNYHSRLSRGNVKTNSVLKWIQEGMRKVTGDSTWAARKDLSRMSRATWNPNDLTLLGCRLDIEHQPPSRGSRSVVQDMPLRDLGRHVQHMPAGDDELDLTRFVRYAMQNPNEDLQYPRDFDLLIQRLGSTTIKPQHSDEAAASRWSQARPALQQAHTQTVQPASTVSTVQPLIASGYQLQVATFVSHVTNSQSASTLVLPVLGVTEKAEEPIIDGPTQSLAQHRVSPEFRSHTARATDGSHQPGTATAETSYGYAPQSLLDITDFPTGVFGEPFWSDWQSFDPEILDGELGSWSDDASFLFGDLSRPGTITTYANIGESANPITHQRSPAVAYGQAPSLAVQSTGRNPTSDCAHETAYQAFNPSESSLPVQRGEFVLRASLKRKLSTGDETTGDEQASCSKKQVRATRGGYKHAEHSSPEHSSTSESYDSSEPLLPEEALDYLYESYGPHVAFHLWC